ncbi:protein kinase, putative, partial [Entamoeba invadens IP1]
AEIILSLHYIHALGCVHKDIKPDNILIDKNGHLVLTDFGLSSYGFVSEESVQALGTFCTPDYAAPEILISNTYSFASDYFALGCMMYEFVVGYPPFNASTPEAIFMKIQEGVFVWPHDVEVSDKLKDLIKRLLNHLPEQRPTFNDIEKHPFFNGIHWSTLFDEKRDDIFVPELETEKDTGYFEDERMIKQMHMKKSDIIIKPSSKIDVVKRKESPIVPSSVEFGNFDAKNVDNLVEENRKLYAKEFAKFEATNL